MSPAISIRNLGKCYQVNHAASGGGYQTLRDALAGAFAAPLHRWRGRRHCRSEDFWALKDVCFDVEAGEVIGIIGRNGAGKSTLLKVLSRITKPTVGEVEINGRIGSLLEVGTGFHPELTGRENIFLNGSILGMRRREIERQFEEIVDFSGIERFLEMPVKRYSSGMYVRLAFAVAAHLNPEILIVDEVLAVGDQAFQRKCIRKLSEVTGRGRTVLLVTHQLPILSNLASKVVWLDAGGVREVGDAETIIRNYSVGQMPESGGASVDLKEHPGRNRGAKSVLTRIAIFDKDMNPATAVLLGDSMYIQVDLADFMGNSEHHVVVEVCDAYGSPLGTLNSRVQSRIDLTGRCSASLLCRLNSIRLLPGEYRLNVALGDSDYIDRVEAAASFSIEPADIYGTGLVPRNRFGLFAFDVQWGLANSA